MQYHAKTTNEQKKIDGRYVQLSPRFRRINYSELGPEVEPHRFTNQGKGTGDQCLACNDGSYCSNGNSKIEEPFGHHSIKRIKTTFNHISRNHLSFIVAQQPCTL